MESKPRVRLNLGGKTVLENKNSKSFDDMIKSYDDMLEVMKEVQKNVEEHIETIKDAKRSFHGELHNTIEQEIKDIFIQDDILEGLEYDSSDIEIFYENELDEYYEDEELEYLESADKVIKYTVIVSNSINLIIKLRIKTAQVISIKGYDEIDQMNFMSLTTTDRIAKFCSKMSNFLSNENLLEEIKLKSEFIIDLGMDLY